MDQVRLSQYIAALLKAHDCVIVPSFGGFVANQAPAKINRINDRFDPPYRKISFNRLLTHNDGLLAAYVAQKESEKFEASLAAIKACAKGLQHSLEQEKRLEFPEVGILTQLSDGSVRFEQDRSASLSLNAYGLESFFSRKIERTAPAKLVIEPKSEQKSSLVATPEPKPVEEAPIVVKLTPPEAKTSAPAEEEPQHQGVETQEKKRYWPVAAAIALPLVAYGAWLLFGAQVLSPDQRFHQSDLNPFTAKVCPEYKNRDHQINLDPLSNDDLKINVQDGVDHIQIYNNDRDKTLVVSMEEAIRPAKTNEALRYHVIGGCFSDIGYAEAMVSKHMSAGANASIVEKRGALYRVSVASFATKKEAKRALASIRSEIPNAWLLHK